MPRSTRTSTWERERDPFLYLGPLDRLFNTDDRSSLIMATKATITLDTLDCIVEDDRGGGGSEPYIWPLYFWSDRTLQLRLEFVEIASASIANPSAPLASGMRAGDRVELPFPPFTREIDFALGGEGIGVIVVVLEADDTPDSAMTVGRNTLRDLLRTELRAFIRNNGRPPNSGDQPDTEDEVTPIVERIKEPVKDAIKGELNFWQRLDQAGSGKDDFLGSDHFFQPLTEGEFSPEDIEIDVREGDPPWQHYRVTGRLVLEPSDTAPPRCGPQREALRRARERVETIELEITLNQAQLHNASPAEKAFLIERSRELGDELPAARAAVTGAEGRLADCLD